MRVDTGWVLGLGVALAACSPAASTTDIEAQLKAATLKALGSSVAPEEVSVSGFNRSLTRTEWKAVLPQGSYDCDADERLTLPSCTPTGG